VDGTILLIAEGRSPTAAAMAEECKTQASRLVDVEGEHHGYHIRFQLYIYLQLNSRLHVEFCRRLICSFPANSEHGQEGRSSATAVAASKDSGSGKHTKQHQSNLF
jgi:hypothetical protein